MQLNIIQTTFPNICSVLQGSVLNDDIAAALSAAESGEDALRQSLEGNSYKLNALMGLFAETLLSDLNDSAAVALERELSSVIKGVGYGEVRKAYREKLLVDNANTLEDTRYEIAVAARACEALDNGSVKLEHPIADSQKNQSDWKNSDIYGTYHGTPVRIEVTVLHETLPGAIHLDLDDLIRSADTSLGFSVTLSRLLPDKAYAERVRSLLELLAETHEQSRGSSVEIDGVLFEWRCGAYHCNKERSPFSTIVLHHQSDFSGAETMREVIHPVSARKSTPDAAIDDFPNPPGVVSIFEDKFPKVPVSSKIWQMLDRKRAQCEDGAINIIAFGNPLPFHDQAVKHSVLGAEVVAVPVGGGGPSEGRRALVMRGRKSPFTSSASLLSEEEAAEFVQPFRDMSAVWLIRLGLHSAGEFIRNPNAHKAVPDALVAVLLEHDHD